MKLIIDENIPLGTEFFSHLGDVQRLPGRKITPADVKDADALIIRSVTRVDEKLLGSSRVKFVGTCTIGVDHLDLAYLNQQGIRWANAPGCNANSVVEYVYAALSSMDVNWTKSRIGIIGCGNVGGLLYRRLRAQGIQLHCYDPNLTKEQIPDLSSLDDVLACDIVSMHTPLVTDGPYPSFHLLKREQLMQLKQGAVLINAGRGSVISNQDLLSVMNERSDLRVILDVWEPEPEISIPLLKKVVIGTPHIAGYSYDGKLNGTEMIYQAYCQFLKRQTEKNLQDLVPQLNDNILDAGHLTDPWAIVKHLVLQAYNIEADNMRLREAAHDAITNNIAIGEGFDALRKHYPKRNEFHNYKVRYQKANPETKKWLSLLGFNCAE
jgi:erythronate-4-phosphate dehydrogenase